MTTTTHRDRLQARPPAPNALSGLTVVLASAHEAEALPDAVRDATDAAARCAVAHEIVIVDDGTAGERVAVAAALAARDPRVRLVVYAERLGYGDAVRAGIAAARMPWVLLTDAGVQFDVRDLEDVLPVAASADLVLGWCVLPQGPVGARAQEAIWQRFLRAALDLPVRDVDCAFRLARRELLGRLDLRASGALVGAELLVRSRAAGARTAEAPVHERVRSAGPRTARGRRLTARTLRELADLRRALRDGHAAA
jgi:glycosyltransferase involved in cell wall biosynthesis